MKHNNDMMVKAPLASLTTLALPSMQIHHDHYELDEDEDYDIMMKDPLASLTTPAPPLMYILMILMMMMAMKHDGDMMIKHDGMII